MLTEEIIKKNEHLASLTTEQISEITRLSKADEDNVIGETTGRIHGSYENDVVTITGVQKNQGEKAYNYVKRILGEYKEKATPNLTRIAELEQEKTELTEKLKNNGSDAAVRQQLADANALLQTLKEQHAAEKTEYEKRMADIRFGHAFDAAKAGIVLKKSYSDNVKASLINAAQAELNAKYSVEFLEDGTIQLRDKKDNSLAIVPGTVDKLTMSSFLASFLKDDIEPAPAGGTGTMPPDGGVPNGDTLDMSGITTQVQAEEAISAYLLKKGLVRYEQKFAAEKDRLWKEYKISEMKIQ